MNHGQFPTQEFYFGFKAKIVSSGVFLPRFSSFLFATTHTSLKPSFQFTPSSSFLASARWLRLDIS
jgi:hypothetical protein